MWSRTSLVLLLDGAEHPEDMIGALVLPQISV